MQRLSGSNGLIILRRRALAHAVQICLLLGQQLLLFESLPLEEGVLLQSMLELQFLLLFCVLEDLGLVVAVGLVCIAH